MSSLPKILALVGPTASGKTPVSLELAKTLNGEIISADSRQVYKYLDIGTAKPTVQELRTLPHHFIDIFEPDRDYSAGEFGAEARGRVLEVLKRGKTPLVVGGSGLYVKALIDGLFEGPKKDVEIRERLENKMKEQGIQILFETLQRVDAESARKMDVLKPRRIIRALEVYYVTGKPISQLQEQDKNRPPFRAIQFAIQWDRELLYARINRRVDDMMRQGLVDEVHALKMRGYGLQNNALNTVGYKEVLQHLHGDLDVSEMVELIKQNTRRFAKRQLTWFRADKRIRWVEGEENVSEVAKDILSAFAKAM